MHMSLDGYVCGPNGELDWCTMDDDEVGKYLIGDLLTSVDTMLLGRSLYKGFESYWPATAVNPETPKELAEFAHWIDDSPKYVFSQTMEKVEWKNSFLVKGDVTEEITKLKLQPGGDMVVFGGAAFAASLAGLDLIDEYRLKLEPKILGAGRPLFKDVTQRSNLKLIKAKSFNSGVVGLYYEIIRSQ